MKLIAFYLCFPDFLLLFDFPFPLGLHNVPCMCPACALHVPCICPAYAPGAGMALVVQNFVFKKLFPSTFPKKVNRASNEAALVEAR